MFPQLCFLLLPLGLFRFYEDIENMVQVLEVALSGGKASMVLLMPFHVESLSRLEKLLTVERLSKWLDKTNVTSVSLSLPKANITSTLSLQVSIFFLSRLNAITLKYMYVCLKKVHTQAML